MNEISFGTDGDTVHHVHEHTIVALQQQGHSGKALKKKKYRGRNSGTETKI
jgi:hypothetical protein